LGGIITLTSFIGCFGAHLENTGFLNTYSSITAIALIIELSKVYYNDVSLEILISNLVAMGLAYTHQIQVIFFFEKKMHNVLTP
jgi:hypothetical protein